MTKISDVNEHINVRINGIPSDTVFSLIHLTIQDCWKSARSNLKMPGKACRLKKALGSLGIELRRGNPNHTQCLQSVQKSLACYKSYSILWYE
ncbi:MAG: hypothetical protein KC483_05545 [Nitrosarchaeum sp.]|nr:hypothetical protein [Nitrosarchaeum sp.]